MALGTWDPKLAAHSEALQLQPALLQKLIAFDTQESLAQLDTLLSSEDKQTLSALMKLDHALWRAAAEPRSDADLLSLIRFFAVAENLPGWEAGPKSPVIPLARLLRERGARLDTSLLQWLRSVNDNRYLPYGPL
jgi:hypothetical protein